MNTHRAVRQYLAKEEKKTELKSERVELAGAAEIAKMTAEVKKGLDAVNTKLKEFKAAKDEFAKAESKALKVRATADKAEAAATKIVVKADKLINKVTTMAEDLGVSERDVKGLSELISLANDLEDNGTDLSSYDFNLGQ